MQKVDLDLGQYFLLVLDGCSVWIVDGADEMRYLQKFVWCSVDRLVSHAVLSEIGLVPGFVGAVYG